MTKISEALTYGLTIRESATDGSDFTNPAADYRRLFLGEDGLLHLRDSSGTVTAVGGTGDVATDAIWDAAGDLAVGSGANTAAKLTAGADSTVLTISPSTHVPVWAAPSAGGLSSYATYLTGLSGLVHRWKFEEASGNFIDDVGSLDLTPSGSWTYSVAGGPVSGASGSAEVTSSAYATSSGLGSLPVAGAARTIVSVFRGKSSASQQCLLSYGAMSTRNWFAMMLNANATVDAAGVSSYGDDLDFPKTTVNAEAWHMFIGAYDGVGVEFGVFNGAYGGKRMGSAMNTTNSGNFVIGRETGGSGQCGAVVFDDLAVFNRLLQPWEIQQLLVRFGT